MKVNKIRGLLVIVLVIATLPMLFCEHKDSVGVNDSQACDVVWKQSGLDSLWVGVLANNYSGEIFAGSNIDGIFRSTDHGANWDFFAPYIVRSIAINTEGDLFAALQEGFTNRLLRTTNSGVSWDILDVAPFVNLKPIVITPSGKIVVGAQTSDESKGGIYVSIDKGDNWVSADFPDTVSVNALIINNEAQIVAGTALGVFKSIDNGNTWVALNNGFQSLPFNDPYVDALAVHPITGELFASLSATQAAGIYHLVNGVWLRTNLTTTGLRALVFNRNGELFAGGLDRGGAVFCSSDKGENWTAINTGLGDTDVFTLMIDTSGFLYCGTRGKGAFRSMTSLPQ